MTARTLLAIRDLTVRRGRDPVVSGVSLELDAGEVLAITGPNGGGKTSLVRAILGEIEFSGSIEIAPRDRGRIGYVPQVFDFDRSLPVTVRDFLALPLQRWPSWIRVMSGNSRRIEDVLARVDLPGHAGRLLGELSGGELQRVLFAQALLAEPELLLLDEPTQGMDEPARARFDAEILRLVGTKRVGVLMVSHDPDQMRRLAHRVVRLDRTLVPRAAPGLDQGAA